VRYALLFALAACFHTRADIRTAQTATYKMTGAAMMSLAEDVAKHLKYPVADVDDKNFHFAAGDLTVTVTELAGGDCSVDVRAKAEGSAQQQADSLAVDIYERAKAAAYH